MRLLNFMNSQNTMLMPSQGSVRDNHWNTDVQVVHQLEDMKEQTTYMTEFRSALKYALEEVQTLRNELAEEKSKGFDEISSHIQRSKEIDLRIASKETSLHKPCLDFNSDINSIVLKETEALSSQNETLEFETKADHVIEEAASRVEHIREKVVQRNSVITKLRKQLQKTSLLLRKREQKLEQKLDNEKLLKSQSDDLIRDRDEHKQAAEKAKSKVAAISAAMQEKEAQVKALQTKLHSLDEQMRAITSRVYQADEYARYCKMQWDKERDYAIHKHHECMRLRRSMDDMQRQLHRLTVNQNTDFYSNQKMQPKRGARYDAPNYTVPFSNYSRLKRVGNTQKHLSPIQEDVEDLKSTNHVAMADLKSNHAPGCNISDEKQEACTSSSSSLDASAYPYLVVDSLRAANIKPQQTGRQEHTNYAFSDKHISPALNQNIHELLSKPVAKLQSEEEASDLSIPSPCSSVFSAVEESRLSDVTTNSAKSSDLGAKKSSRKQKHKSKRHVRYCGHKIDVTKFDMQDFRQIMWALSSEEQSVDSFLDFLACESKRLNSDPKWRDRHTLGNEDDWLNLKGCY